MENHDMHDLFCVSFKPNKLDLSPRSNSGVFKVCIHESGHYCKCMRSHKGAANFSLLVP